MKTTFSLLCAVLFTVGVAEAARAPKNPSGVQAIGIIQTTDIDFPDSLARMYVNGGEARILITVRGDGELTEWLVTGYTALPFRAEAVRALKELKFSPARADGQPIAARSEVTFRFESHRALVSTSSSADSFMVANPQLFEGNDVYRAYPVGNLDRVPRASNVVAPIYPKELADQGVRGSVTVDFYIDEEGTVRMPSVVEHEPIALATAAVTAVRQWKFEAPLRHGKPVLAHVRQVFNFGSQLGLTAMK